MAPARAGFSDNTAALHARAAGNLRRATGALSSSIQSAINGRRLPIGSGMSTPTVFVWFASLGGGGSATTRVPSPTTGSTTPSAPQLHQRRAQRVAARLHRFAQRALARQPAAPSALRDLCAQQRRHLARDRSVGDQRHGETAPSTRRPPGSRQPRFNVSRPKFCRRRRATTLPANDTPASAHRSAPPSRRATPLSPPSRAKTARHPAHSKIRRRIIRQNLRREYPDGWAR